MEELKEIKCYWAGEDYNFNDRNMWEGKILLHEDGWFEGIVVDPYSAYTKDRFVFGIYHPDKVIELFKFTPRSVSSPFVFHGKKSSEGYNGDFDIISLSGPIFYGISHITTQDAKNIRGNVDTEVEELKLRIQKYKDSMDNADKSFYDNYVAIRNHMCQIILRNYEGGGFSPEETWKILDELESVNQSVMKATRKEIGKMIKKLL